MLKGIGFFLLGYGLLAARKRGWAAKSDELNRPITLFGPAARDRR